MEDLAWQEEEKKPSNLTLEEQLANVQAEIDGLMESVKELKARKKELLEKIAKKEKEEVYNAYLQSGKSLDDVIALLSNSEPTDTIEK